MKPAIIRTSNPAPWFHLYQYATHGFAVRIGPRRMLAFVRVHRPAVRHEPLTGWDLTYSGFSDAAVTYCRHCRIPWPCTGYVDAQNASHSHENARAWTSATLGHVTALTVCVNMLIHLLAAGTALPVILVWVFTTCVVTATILGAANLRRMHRRMARIHEGLTRD